MDLKTPEILLLCSGIKGAMRETFFKAVIKYDFSLKFLDLVQPICRDVPVNLTLDGSHVH